MSRYSAVELREMAVVAWGNGDMLAFRMYQKAAEAAEVREAARRESKKGK